MPRALQPRCWAAEHRTGATQSSPHCNVRLHMVRHQHLENTFLELRRRQLHPSAMLTVAAQHAQHGTSSTAGPEQHAMLRPRCTAEAIWADFISA